MASVTVTEVLNMRARIFQAALLGLCMSFVGIAGAQQMGSEAALQNASQTAPALRIGPGDVLTVTVFDIPSMSAKSLRVAQNGTIDLPLVGPLQIAGMTADQAGVYIADQLKSKGLVLHPAVIVSVDNMISQGASISGQVRSPGIYPLYGTHRLLDMLAIAGGLTDSAGKLVTIIHRDAPHDPVYVGLAENPTGLKAQKNPVILPGDMIIVAKAGIVYVVGDVGHAGAYLLNNNERITLLQALSLAGGVSNTAKLSHTKLIRRLPDGKEEISLNLKKIYNGQEADLLMDDGDIIYVPQSGLKTFIYQGIGGITNLASSVGIYTTR